jgi:hypothetical protein
LYQLRDVVTVLLLVACFLLNLVGPLLCVDSSTWASAYGLLPSDEQSQGMVVNATYLLQVSGVTRLRTRGPPSLSMPWLGMGRRWGKL